jgi:hypothetical protein
MITNQVITLITLFVYISLLLVTLRYAKATEELAKVTHRYSEHTGELVVQQKAVAEMNVMPQIHIEFWDPSKAIYIKVERNIAEILEGGVWLEKDEAPSRRVIVGKINPSTAMPWQGGKLTIALLHIKDELDKLDIGEKVRIQVDLKYRSILGGQYRSSHWIILEKSESKENPFKRLLTDMKFEKKPWQDLE